MIVYLARNIPAFVMYCVYGESRSSLHILHIETTDSMISPVFKSQHRAYDTEKGQFFLARFKAKMW